MSSASAHSVMPGCRRFPQIVSVCLILLPPLRRTAQRRFFLCLQVKSIAFQPAGFYKCSFRTPYLELEPGRKSIPAIRT